MNKILNETPIKILNPNGVAEYGRTSNSGYFGLFNGDITPNLAAVSHCRDECLIYYKKFDKNKYIGFLCDINSTKTKNINNVVKFWELISEKLGEKFSIQIHPTQFPSLYLIEPSAAWVENDTDISLLALFIRWSFCYFQENLENSYKLYNYANSTKLAIEYFLEGHTKPTYEKFTPCYDYGSYLGWVSEFKPMYCTEDEMKKKLVKPT